MAVAKVCEEKFAGVALSRKPWNRWSPEESVWWLVPSADYPAYRFDNAEWALDRGRALAIEHGVADRVAFVTEDASVWAKAADRVVCIGASHAWGGTTAALRGLRRVVRPGGLALFGDGCWDQAPTTAASQLFGDDVLPLGALVDEAIRVGWRILHLSTADQREWDDFESTWRSGREQWLQSNAADPRAPELRADLDQRLREYLTAYRGILGFVYLVLAR